MTDKELVYGVAALPFGLWLAVGIGLWDWPIAAPLPLILAAIVAIFGFLAGALGSNR